MRSLTELVAGNAVETPDASGDAEALPPAENRAAAERLLAGVEAYFRGAEPSSPIPMLLAKARDYLKRDFLFILKDMTEKMQDEG